MKTILLLAPVAGLLLASLCAGQTDARSEDRARIRNIIDDFQTTWNRHDVPAMSRLFAEDSSFTNVRGQVLKGRAAFAADTSRIHETFYKQSKITDSNITELRFLGRDAALVLVDSGITANTEKPDDFQFQPHQLNHRRTCLMFVLTKERGNGSSWQVRTRMLYPHQ